MTWNYRIVRYKGEGECYGLHEVYYDDTGKPTGMSAQPCGFVSDSPDELYDLLFKARIEARKRPVLDEPVDWHD